MGRIFALIGISVIVLTQAWGTDLVAVDAAGAGGPGYRAAAGKDAELELAWDNGTRSWAFAYYTGANVWVGNDFSIATLKAADVYVRNVRFYTSSTWPNTSWNGFRVGIFDYSGGIPASRLWPTGSSGYFFLPTGLNGHVWVDIPVNWICPVTRFVAAVDQTYNYPNCDPYTLDNNPTFRGHSWLYYQGSWDYLDVTSLAPYRNAMLRAVVETEYTSVTPSSLGRVKAIYY